MAKPQKEGGARGNATHKMRGGVQTCPGKGVGCGGMNEGETTVWCTHHRKKQEKKKKEKAQPRLETEKKEAKVAPAKKKINQTYLLACVLSKAGHRIRMPKKLGPFSRFLHPLRGREGTRHGERANRQIAKN